RGPQRGRLLRRGAAEHRSDGRALEERRDPAVGVEQLADGRHRPSGHVLAATRAASEGQTSSGAVVAASNPGDAGPTTSGTSSFDARGRFEEIAPMPSTSDPRAARALTTLDRIGVVLALLLTL